jgi:hypothetical protein
MPRRAAIAFCCAPISRLVRSLRRTEDAAKVQQPRSLDPARQVMGAFKTIAPGLRPWVNKVRCDLELAKRLQRCHGSRCRPTMTVC